MGAVVMLAGCTTTMEEAARLQLNSARIRAAEVSTSVLTPNPSVRVTGLSVISVPGAHTFVVSVHNTQSAAVTDLPISVGVSPRRGHAEFLNARATQELSSYYDAHLPRIAAGATLTWVFTTARRLPAHARPFARVGVTPSPRTGAGRWAPRLLARITGSGTAARHRGWLRLTLRNRSGIPQYQVPVYVVARRGRRVVAAGRQIVTELGSGQKLSLRVPVQGSLSDARIQVAALPTIVH